MLNKTADLLLQAALTLVFFLVFTPIGLISRALGKDFLYRGCDPKTPSYWIIRKP
jgi:hypothetical protein